MGSPVDYKQEARNSYENYIYQMKATIEDEKLKEKLGDNYDKIKDKLAQGEEVLSVIEVSKDEYEKAQKELENFINPIMQEIVKEGGGENMEPGVGPMPGHSPSDFVPSEPPIDEID